MKIFKDHNTMGAILNTNICIELLNSMKKEKYNVAFDINFRIR